MNEKCVFYFTEKTKRTFWPTQYISVWISYWSWLIYLLNVLFQKFIFRERGRKGAGEGERNQCERETSITCLSQVPRLRPKGLCPDQESNKRLLAFPDNTQSTEPHRSGRKCLKLENPVLSPSFPLPSTCWRIVYLIVSYCLEFADCISTVSSDMLPYHLFFYKLVVVSKDLIRFGGFFAGGWAKLLDKCCQILLSINS